MYEWRVILYGTIVLCFLGAGVCEFLTGNFRIGTASLLLGVVQALIFIGGRD